MFIKKNNIYIIISHMQTQTNIENGRNTIRLYSDNMCLLLSPLSIYYLICLDLWRETPDTQYREGLWCED